MSIQRSIQPESEVDRFVAGPRPRMRATTGLLSAIPAQRVAQAWLGRVVRARARPAPSEQAQLDTGGQVPIRLHAADGSSDPAAESGVDSPDTIRTGLAILIVTSEAPPVVSGISKTVGLLDRGLTELGNVVHVISRDDFPRFMRGEFRFSAFAFYWPSVRRRLAAYDVVNLHGPVPTISEVFLLLSRTLHRANRPAIVYTHHSDLSIASWERICGVYNTLTRRMAHQADAVVVSSSAYRQRLDRLAGKPVSVIPWAIESGQSELSRRAPEPGTLKVLFVGQLRSYKGLHVLLDAVQNQPEIALTIVGDGPLRGELDRRVAGAGLSNVTMRGRLPDAELCQAYDANEVIVLPSTTTAEAYGLVLAEGMARGCVPVASDLPGVSELAGETGLVVPPDNAAALRSALLLLARDPAVRERMSAASLSRSELLSVSSMANQYQQVFRSAVETTAFDRALDVVPRPWGRPDDLLRELTVTLGITRSSLTLVSKTTDPYAHIWLGSSVYFRGLAPIADHIAKLNRPVLLSPEIPWDAELQPLMRAEVTSSILIPIHWTRRGVSIVALSTTAEDDRLFGRADLSRALRVIAPQTVRKSA